MRLLKIAAIIVTIGVALAGCDRFRSVETIVARGQAQYRNGNFRAAIGDFKTALQRDAGNVKARVELARALYHLGDFEDAQHSIDTAIDSGATDADAIALKYQVLLSSEQYQLVVKNVGQEPALAESMRTFLLGKAYAGLGERAQAATSYERAIELSPADAKILVAQARLYLEIGDFARANEILDGVLLHDAENADAWVVRAAVRDATADMPGAKLALETAQKLSPRQLNWNEQARVAAGLADIDLRMRNIDGATRAIADLNRRAPQTALVYYLQARLALLNNNTNDAVAQLQKAIQLGDHLPSQLLLANVQLMRGNYGQVQTQLDKILSAHPGNAEARKLLVKLYLATNRVADAQKVLSADTHEPGPDEHSDSQLDWLRGETLFAAGSRDEAVTLLEKSLAANKNNVPHALQLARAYIATGAREKAVTLLQSLPADANGMQRQGLLVIASVMGKNAAESNKEIDILLARFPQDSNLHAAAGTVVASAGDIDRGVALLNKAILLDKSNSEARISLSSVLSVAGKFAEAEQQLQTVVAQDAKNAIAYIGLAKLALATNHKDQAIKYLEQAIGVQPSAVEPRMLLAQLAFADRDYKRASDLLEQAVAAANGASATINAAGVLLFQARQFDDAITYFERAGVDGNVFAKLNAARVQIAQGKKNDARLRLEALTGESSIRFPAVALLAQLDCEAGKYDAALARVAGLRKLNSDAKAADELEGDIYTSAKQFSQAQLYYERAYRSHPTQRLVIKRYRTLALSHDTKARTVLTAWLIQAPKDIAVRKLLANDYLANGDHSAAAREYEILLNSNTSRDPEVLNDLAWLYGEKSDERALPLAREAYVARPGSAEIADTYGWLLLNRDEVTQALPILEKAWQAAQTNPEIQYHYAAAQLRAGDRRLAQGLLKDDLDKHKHFASRDSAMRLSQSID